MYVDEHFGSSNPTPGSLSAPRDKIPQWISAYYRILLETERDPRMGDSADLLFRPLVPILRHVFIRSAYVRNVTGFEKFTISPSLI